MIKPGFGLGKKQEFSNQTSIVFCLNHGKADGLSGIEGGAGSFSIASISSQSKSINLNPFGKCNFTLTEEAGQVPVLLTNNLNSKDL